MIGRVCIGYSQSELMMVQDQCEAFTEEHP